MVAAVAPWAVGLVAIRCSGCTLAYRLRNVVRMDVGPDGWLICRVCLGKLLGLHASGGRWGVQSPFMHLGTNDDEGYHAIEIETAQSDFWDGEP